MATTRSTRERSCSVGAPVGAARGAAASRATPAVNTTETVKGEGAIPGQHPSLLLSVQPPDRRATAGVKARASTKPYLTRNYLPSLTYLAVHPFGS